MFFSWISDGVCLFQGARPSSMAGASSEDAAKAASSETELFRLQWSRKGAARAVQVEKKASSLYSEGVSVLCLQDKVISFDCLFYAFRKRGNCLLYGLWRNCCVVLEHATVAIS